jgi:hypothetical protein
MWPRIFLCITACFTLQANMRGYEASPGSSILVEVVPYECVSGGGRKITGVWMVSLFRRFRMKPPFIHYGHTGQHLSFLTLQANISCSGVPYMFNDMIWLWTIWSTLFQDCTGIWDKNLEKRSVRSKNSNVSSFMWSRMRWNISAYLDFFDFS